MRYWWVNQNQTYRHEVLGGFLWSPKTKSDGHRNPFYDTMAEARPGDVVFSFADTLVKALGIVRAPASTAPKPTEYGSAGATWANEGWFVKVEFSVLRQPIKPKEHIERLRPLLPAKYSPLQSSGDGNQVVYLTELPAALARALGALVGREFQLLLASARHATHVADDEAAEAVVAARADIPETQKAQLINARRGQGLFRSRVELVEPSCRVTGIRERQHLRASHILPWRFANDQQKLDGNNGLLLSPHVDHLFDEGFITFEGDGSLLVSPVVNEQVLIAWSIAGCSDPRPFSAEQARYLDYHRHHIFRRQA